MLHIAIEASHYACLPFADPNDDYPAKMFFYPNDLAKEGLINEWVFSDNWQGIAEVGGREAGGGVPGEVPGLRYSDGDDPRGSVYEPDSGEGRDLESV